MSLVLFDKIEHLLVVIAAIAALTLLCLFAGLSTDVAVPIIATLGGVSSAAAAKQAVSGSTNGTTTAVVAVAPTASTPPPSGGVQAAGGPTA